MRQVPYITVLVAGIFERTSEDDFFFEDDVFSLEPAFDFIEGEFDPTFNPVITQSAFDEILFGFGGDDTLAGLDGNTNYFFSYFDIGGDDIITDAGGTKLHLEFDDRPDRKLLVGTKHHP